LHLSRSRKRVEGSLHRTLAFSERKRQGGTRPGLTVGEKGQDRRVFFFDGPGEHDDFARMTRCKSKAALGGADDGQPPKYPPEASDFDAQAGAMRFIDDPRAECPSKEQVPRHIFRPRFPQRSCESEQNRTPCEGNHCAGVTHRISACIDDERLGPKQGFDIFQP
jgi:hypothetical protein